MMRQHLLSLVVCLIMTGSALAEDVSALLARADQAFASADYTTALAIYQRIESKVTDADQRSAMQERMRFASRQIILIQQRGPATQPAPDATVPATDDANRVKHVKPKDGETMQTTLHELGNFNIDEDATTPIPDDVKNLSGSKIRVSGQMMPLDQAGKLTRFLLVNDMMSCCYGTAPKLQNVMYVKLPEGKVIEPTYDRLTLEGTLKVEVRKEDGVVLNIFELQPSSIKAAE